MLLLLHILYLGFCFVDSSEETETRLRGDLFDPYYDRQILPQEARYFWLFCLIELYLYNCRMMMTPWMFILESPPPGWILTPMESWASSCGSSCPGEITDWLGIHQDTKTSICWGKEIVLTDIVKTIVFQSCSFYNLEARCRPLQQARSVQWHPCSRSKEFQHQCSAFWKREHCLDCSCVSQGNKKYKFKVL